MARLAFFGTSDRSVPILESLNQHFDISLCITKEDTRIGRKQTLKETGVKKWAKENRVNFIAISNSLNKEIDHIIEQIKLSKPDVGVVADFKFLISQEILDLFPKGLINVHFSLLPKYRGASPVQQALLNGDASTGITYQLMRKELDKGPVISKQEVLIDPNETSGDLYKRMFVMASISLPNVLKDYLDGTLSPTPQDESCVSWTYPVKKTQAKINWSNSTQSINDLIRAYNPWPIAWTTLQELQSAKDKIIGFTKLKDVNKSSKIIKIYTAKIVENKLKVDKIQPEGGMILDWEQFKNGYLA